MLSLKGTGHGRKAHLDASRLQPTGSPVTPQPHLMRAVSLPKPNALCVKLQQRQGAGHRHVSSIPNTPKLHHTLLLQRTYPAQTALHTALHPHAPAPPLAHVLLRWCSPHLSNKSSAAAMSLPPSPGSLRMPAPRSASAPYASRHSTICGRATQHGRAGSCFRQE